MRASRFGEITAKYSDLTIGLIGDFCLDRYFEIDAEIQAPSIETGLPVHAVTHIRNQPGGAGTILNNLVALSVKTIFPIGLTGDDGECFELRRALEQKRGVSLKYFLTAPNRITPTYCKPLLIEAGQTPRELSRLDLGMNKPIESPVESQLVSAANALFKNEQLDAVILLEQFDSAGMSVISPKLLEEVRALTKARPKLVIIGDSRRGLRGWPPIIYKMNQSELGLLGGRAVGASEVEWQSALREIAKSTGRPVILTRGQQGIAAITGHDTYFAQALPTRGEIDIVGAGDCVTANLATSLAAGAKLEESLQIANAAASIVIHQIGATGTASVQQIKDLVRFD